MYMIIPQDSVAGHKSKLHLIFQGQVSRSQYIYASLLTAMEKIFQLSGQESEKG